MVVGKSIGKYTRDFYIVPTILIHNGDNFYYSIEFAWIKWYLGITITTNNNTTL